MRARTVALFVSVAMASACSSGPGVKNRSAARNILAALVVVAGAGAVGAAAVSENKEQSLRDDVKAGTLTGRQFAERDTEGQHWNRAARASAFVAGLGVVGLGILWEMSIGDRIQNGPIDAPAAPQALLPAPVAPPVAPWPAAPPAPAQSWATAR
jgi:hypothetical protein